MGKETTTEMDAISLKNIIKQLKRKKSILQDWGTQREYSSKPLKHSIVKRILVFKR